LDFDPMVKEAYISINFSHIGIILDKENTNQLATDDKIEKKIHIRSNKQIASLKKGNYMLCHRTNQQPSITVKLNFQFKMA